MANKQCYQTDCIQGMKQNVADDSIDLIFTDPPYGIDGNKLDVHYHRDETKVVPGYIDVAFDEYEEFSENWIKECERCLKPGGSMYIVSGYTCLIHILNALKKTSLVEVNHIIAEYSFGVSTKKKWVSSHYHVLYYVKPPITKKTFNTNCYYSDQKDSYNDRLSVQKMNREYKPGQKKNKNQLPLKFIEKFIMYSSNRGDTVMDPFSGGFTTAKVALAYGRNFVGFEKNVNAFNAFVPELDNVEQKADPVPIDPSPEELEKRNKMREAWKKKRLERKQSK